MDLIHRRMIPLIESHGPIVLPAAQLRLWCGEDLLLPRTFFFFFLNVLLYRVMTEQQHRVGDAQPKRCFSCGESGEVGMKDREWEISGRLPGSLGQHSLQFRWRF